MHAFPLHGSCIPWVPLLSVYSGSSYLLPFPDDGLHFSFISDNTSHKQDELNTVDDVNVAFLDPSSTNWVSVCGKAKTHQDREQINKLWNPMVSAWFGDLGDGVHKGNKEDPRVCII